MSTTSGTIPIDQYFIDPSVAIEVNESASNHFYSENPNFYLEVNAAQSGMVEYDYSLQQPFFIGSTSPSSESSGSGIQRFSTTTTYFDELGTTTGITARLQNTYGVSNPQTTQSPCCNLPGLNVQCYLYMYQTGIGSGSWTPGSGWYMQGTKVAIQAYPSADSAFEGWTGTGNNAYTGTNNPATIYMSSYTTEACNFNLILIG